MTFIKIADCIIKVDEILYIDYSISQNVLSVHFNTTSSPLNFFNITQQDWVSIQEQLYRQPFDLRTISQTLERRE